jgi:hypothetical protein
MLAGSYFRRRSPAGFLRNTARSVSRDPAVLRYYAALPARRRRRR